MNQCDSLQESTSNGRFQEERTFLIWLGLRGKERRQLGQLSKPPGQRRCEKLSCHESALIHSFNYGQNSGIALWLFEARLLLSFEP